MTLSEKQSGKKSCESRAKEFSGLTLKEQSIKGKFNVMDVLKIKIKTKKFLAV